MKRLLLPLIAAFSILPIFGINQLKNIEASKVIFCWDIHDTLLDQDKGKRIKMVFKTIWHFMRSRTARHICTDHLEHKGKCGGECIEYSYRQLAQEYCDDAQLVPYPVLVEKPQCAELCTATAPAWPP